MTEAEFPRGNFHTSHSVFKCVFCFKFPDYVDQAGASDLIPEQIWWVGEGTFTPFSPEWDRRGQQDGTGTVLVKAPNFPAESQTVCGLSSKLSFLLNESVHVTHTHYTHTQVCLCWQVSAPPRSGKGQQRSVCLTGGSKELTHQPYLQEPFWTVDL